MFSFFKISGVRAEESEALYHLALNLEKNPTKIYMRDFNSMQECQKFLHKIEPFYFQELISLKEACNTSYAPIAMDCY